VTRRSLVLEANRRVAQQRELEVSCTGTALGKAVQGLLDAWNKADDAAYEAKLATKGRFIRWIGSGGSTVSRHYFLLKRSDHLMVTFGTSASVVAERGLNPNSHGWVSLIRMLPTAEQRTRISVELAKWSVNDKGFIWNGSRYVQMLDGIVAGLDGRYVSNPVADEDYHFISQSLV
jgi:hypothetical protein